LKLLSKINI